MYHERYGFKSGINQSIKQDLDDVVTHAFQYVNDPAGWLDIASNDGTLLSYVPRDVYRVGVDPVQFLCAEAEQHADVIINDYFSSKLHPQLGRFDVITSVSCFYDMPEPGQFVHDVVRVLKEKGVWIIQQNYLLTTLQIGAVDNFCHEHLEYYTLASLEHLLKRFGLEVNEVRVSPVNGGSIRTVVSHRGAFEIDESVEMQRLAEWDYGVQSLKTYQDFADSIAVSLTQLRRLVDDIHTQGKKIMILAASTRGATLWQSAGIDHQQITAAIERNPKKVGANFSAIGVPIISEAEGRKRKPPFMLIGPWFFADQIIERERNYKGKFIIPLPEVRVIDGNG